MRALAGSLVMVAAGGLAGGVAALAVGSSTGSSPLVLLILVAVPVGVTVFALWTQPRWRIIVTALASVAAAYVVLGLGFARMG